MLMPIDGASSIEKENSALYIKISRIQARELEASHVVFGLFRLLLYTQQEVNFSQSFLSFEFFRPFRGH